MTLLQTISLSALLLAPVICQASAITITFQQAAEFGLPGSTLEFDANLTNNTGAAIDLGAANVDLRGSFTIDSTPFLIGPASILSGGSTGFFEIFTVQTGAVDPFSTAYSGVLSITDINDNVLGNATFTAGTTAAPEPSPAALFMVATATALLVRQGQRLHPRFRQRR